MNFTEHAIKEFLVRNTGGNPPHLNGEMKARFL